MYACDYLLLRFKAAGNRGAFGGVQSQTYYAVRQKDGKVEFMYNDPQREKMRKFTIPAPRRPALLVRPTSHAETSQSVDPIYSSCNVRGGLMRMALAAGCQQAARAIRIITTSAAQ